MGGANQSTCPVPTAKKSSTSRSPSTAPTVTPNPIRFHENTQDGDIHFHDDKAGLKCAVDAALFYSHYHPWRVAMSGELTLLGHDGAKPPGRSSVKMIPYIDDKGYMQVEMTVQLPKIGMTVLALDKTAGYP